MADATIVQYANDTPGMASMVDKLREHGVSDIRVGLITVGDKKLYKIEYKIPKGEENGHSNL